MRRAFLLAGASALVLVGCTSRIGDPIGPDAGGGSRADARLTADATPMVDAMPVTVDFAPSNFGQNLLTAGTAPLVLAGNVVIDTDDGTISVDGTELVLTGIVFTTVPQSGAPNIGVFSASSLEVQVGATVVVEGDAALAFAIANNATIAGQIDLSGDIVSAGPGGFVGGTGDGNAGNGPGGGQPSGNADTGGGGAGHVAVGGAGGDRGGDSGGPGGIAYGSGTLVPLVGGSGGASGEGNGLGGGGGGGGAIQISARGIIEIANTGGINAGGGAGQGADDDDGGGGGGSGGSVLLEGGSVKIRSTGIVATNGGGGGAGADVNIKGGDGQSGQLSIIAALGGIATGEGTGGGIGGAGLLPSGTAGTASDGTDNVSDNAGGGGGAGGRIVVRKPGNDPIMGITSPMAGLSVLVLSTL